MKKGNLLNSTFKEYHAFWNTVMLAPYTYHSSLKVILNSLTRRKSWKIWPIPASFFSHCFIPNFLCYYCSVLSITPGTVEALAGILLWITGSQVKCQAGYRRGPSNPTWDENLIPPGILHLMRDSCIPPGILGGISASHLGV